VLPRVIDSDDDVAAVAQVTQAERGLNNLGEQLLVGAQPRAFELKAAHLMATAQYLFDVLGGWDRTTVREATASTTETPSAVLQP
jgi:hypothetical protein